jgi:hypothetical protein
LQAVSTPTSSLLSVLLLGLFLHPVADDGGDWRRREPLGSAIGSGIVTILPEYLRRFKDFDVLVYGIILMAILLFMPEGLLKGLTMLTKRMKEKIVSRQTVIHQKG